MPQPTTPSPRGWISVTPSYWEPPYNVAWVNVAHITDVRPRRVGARVGTVIGFAHASSYIEAVEDPETVMRRIAAATGEG